VFQNRLQKKATSIYRDDKGAIFDRLEIKEDL
jgi:hypothetical protein